MNSLESEKFYQDVVEKLMRLYHRMDDAFSVTLNDRNGYYHSLVTKHDVYNWTQLAQQRKADGLYSWTTLMRFANEIWRQVCDKK